MKTKSINRVIAFVTALFLLLTCFTFSPIVTRAHAAGNTYVLDGGDLPTAGEGTYKDGDSFKAGTGNYFTVYASAKTKIEDKEKTFGDGYKSTKRLNFNGGVNVGTPKDTVSFKTGGAAAVKVWWGAGDAGRQMIIKDASDKQIAVTSGTTEKDALYLSTLKVPAAGQYFLGGDPKKNYIFKIEVTEEAAAQDYVLESKTLATFDAGAKADGDSVKAGTDDFFTIIYSAKSKVDGSDKTFDDGYVASPRINFGGKAGTDKNAVKFTTGSAATVKVWWAEGGDDNRQIVILDSAGKEVTKTSGTHTKNSAYIDTLELANAGTYFLGGDIGNNYIFKVQVTAGGATVERGDWSKVSAPVIASAADDGEGNIEVTVTADVSNDGGDAVVVTMTDKDGKEETKQSLAEGTSHVLKFAPADSGTYTFKAALTREGETDKTSASKTASFKLPLGAPTITSATSKGNGSVEVKWSDVHEATGYQVYCGSKMVGTTDKTAFTVTGLTVGEKYDFTVKAVRGTEVGKEASDVKSAVATKDAQREWGFLFYGTSTGKKKNYYKGDLNLDGKVTVVAESNGGKFQEGSNDGLGFYYTTIPSNQNFTLRAKVHVDTWTYNSGQDGFGIMAIDCLPGTFGGAVNNDTMFWTNSYRVGAQRFAYWYDTETGEANADGVGDKYNMNIGIGVQTKLGMTKDNINTVYTSGAAGTVEFGQYTLETTAVDKGLAPSGTYHSVGNMTNPEQNPASADLTDFVLEIQRNNTGYFLTYYAQDGKTIIGQQKFYEPKALDQLDPDNVYVGFAAARNMSATFSDVTLTTIDPKDDKPAEAKPAKKIAPKLTFESPDIANSDKYTLLVKANVKGSAAVSIGGKAVETVTLDGSDEYAKVIVPIAAGTNKIDVTFTPDAKQELPENTVLSSTAAVTQTKTVKYDTYLAKQNNLYVSPKGTSGGNGSKDFPLDIYTAVTLARAGQNVILMEGTYKLDSAVVIERGISGTADSAINMIADPDAKSRPVLDFGENAAVKAGGLVAAGDYWYFSGFDVTKTPNGIPGILVAGNNCTFDNLKTYTNGDTGLYIRSKGNSADPKSLWPSNNLILNCESFNNADGTGENADGFAAKLTVGAGNVFDGCVSYNNTDDGWDLYARGVSIEPVTIKNCVAYENGHNTDGSKKGNGNGFKLGGENMAGGHTIINSISFNNDANGITCNSCPDIKIENCTSYNNKLANLALYTNNANISTAFTVDGVISYVSSEDDNLNPQVQTLDSLKGKNNYFLAGGKSTNVSGAAVTDDMFVTLTFKGSVARNADNTINMEGFLELTDKAPEDSGAVMGGTASAKFEVTPDADVPNPRTGAEIGFTIAIIALAGAAVFVLIAKRRRTNG